MAYLETRRRRIARTLLTALVVAILYVTWASQGGSHRPNVYRAVVTADAGSVYIVSNARHGPAVGEVWFRNDTSRGLPRLPFAMSERLHREFDYGAFFARGSRGEEARLRREMQQVMLEQGAPEHDRAAVLLPDRTETRVLWPGLIGNLVILTAVSWIVTRIVAVADREWLAHRRRMALALNRCPSCGYDIRSLPQPRCPECGETWEDESAS